METPLAPWFSTSLGDAMLADAALDSLREAFLARCSQVPGAAIWLRHESTGDLHCELVAYFTPACANLARMFAARHCARPAMERLALFVGRALPDAGMDMPPA